MDKVVGGLVVLKTKVLFELEANSSETSTHSVGNSIELVVRIDVLMFVIDGVEVALERRVVAGISVVSELDDD